MLSAVYAPCTSAFLINNNRPDEFYYISLFNALIAFDADGVTPSEVQTWLVCALRNFVVRCERAEDVVAYANTAVLQHTGVVLYQPNRTPFSVVCSREFGVTVRAPPCSICGVNLPPKPKWREYKSHWRIQYKCVSCGALSNRYTYQKTQVEQLKRYVTGGAPGDQRFIWLHPRAVILSLQWSPPSSDNGKRTSAASGASGKDLDKSDNELDE
jgi:hypothetical protein